MTASSKLKNQSHIGTPPWRVPKPQQLKEIWLKALGVVGSYRNRVFTATYEAVPGMHRGCQPGTAS